MKIQKIDLATSFFSLYIENDQGLVFHFSKKSLYSVNPLVIAFVFAIDEGLSEQEAIQQVTNNLSCDLDVLFTSYREAKSFFSNHKSLINYSDGQYPELKTLKGLSRVKDKNCTQSYQVNHTYFSISCKNQSLSKEINNLLRPIESKLSQVHFQLLIKQSKINKGYYDIFCNNLLIEQRLVNSEVIPLIIDRMQILTFQHSEYFYCFHGAALRTTEGMLLLPGSSGAGKSTLSAILAAKKNKLYSDEMIVLNKDFNADVLKLPIAVKSGSWEVLSELYPELITSEEFKRIDGRRLKYVWPYSFANKQGLENDTSEQCIILNPKFIRCSNDNFSARKLSVIDTITMFIESGYQLGFELSESKLELLINFVENATRYHLNYSTSEQAELGLKFISDSTHD